MSLDVFQAHLDKVSEALLKDDFDAYFAVCCVPLVLITERTTKMISTEEEYRFGFENYAGLLKSQHATDLIRLAHDVEQLSPELMSGRYETHVLSGGKRIYGPFRSSMALRLEGETWKAAVILSPVHGAHWPINAIRPETGGASA